MSAKAGTLYPTIDSVPTGSATLSLCGEYRYVLKRHIPCPLRWVKPVLFVMLNPSTADAEKDDPTIRRCLSFARREGGTALTVVNLFALRATNPRALAASLRPHGTDNVNHVAREVQAHRLGLVIAAWGAHEDAPRSFVEAFVRLTPGVMCLGKTKSGAPRHPLYVRADTPLEPFGPARQS